MYAHLSLFGRNHDKKIHFSQFLKGPLQFIKITLHGMGYMGINCFEKTLLSRYLCVFNKNEVNFTRSCAFAQKVKFYALQMLKKQSLTHPNAAKLATLHGLLITRLTNSFYLSVSHINICF